LSGNWSGARDRLAGEGIQLNAEFYEVVQGVAKGGLD
jgi:hypothetical protein